MTEVTCGRDSGVWKEEREPSIWDDRVGRCRKFGFSFANENFKQNFWHSLADFKGPF